MTKKEIINRVWGRTGKNIFGWGLFTGIWLYNVPIGTDYAPSLYWMFRFIIFGLVIGMCYFNNLFLIPKFLVRKKYLLYIVLVLFFTFLSGFCFNLAVKLMHLYFSKMKVGEVSFIMTRSPVGWTVGALLSGAQNHFFFVLEFVVIMTMAWGIRQYTWQQKTIEEARKKQVETELTFLKGQLNPHFLFNNLNNLYGLALKKSEDTPGAILKLSSILRYLLYESDIDCISFEKEKEVMNAYIDIELLRLSDVDNLNFTISADKNYQIAPLLWLPILENVFKHATRVITDHYHIDYRFEIKDNNLTIYSKNNYKANGNGVKEKNGGIGLSNLKKRLALLYPGQHSVETSHDDYFYTTEVKINLA
jgi:two-component system LytT family sensor kinase